MYKGGESLSVAQKVRMERLERIRRFIKTLKANIGEDVNKVVAWFAVTTGLREKVVREYLALLSRAGVVELENRIIKEVHEEKLIA